MTGPDTPPEPVDPGDDDWPDTVQVETRSITLVCPECKEYVRVRDVHAYVLSNHLAVCSEMALLNGDSG